MRKIVYLALLVGIAGCSGSSASGPSEETRAAELIHGVKDGVSVGGTIVQKANSPAAFELTSKDPAALKITVAVSKISKCKYHGEVTFSDATLKMSYDLTNLDTENYPEFQPDTILQNRLLRGAVTTCEIFTLDGKPVTSMDDKLNRFGRDPCELVISQKVVDAFSPITLADFKALAKKFEQDFCQ